MTLIERPDFSIYFNGIYEVAGSYAIKIFVEIFGRIKEIKANIKMIFIKIVN